VELATARAPRDGVVTWVASDEGATVHRGDVLARVARMRAGAFAAQKKSSASFP